MAIKLPLNALKPGDNASITLESSPNSTVFLSAVDSSVNFLKSSKDDFRRTIISEFLKGSKLPEVSTIKNNRYPEFSESNTILLTNAVKGYVDCSTSRLDFREDEIISNLDETMEVGTVAARKDFPETWMFESFNLKNGVHEITKQVPDTITNWVISGFSLNPENGLGFTETQKLRVMKKFFVQVEMPQSMILGEIARIDVFVHNQKKYSKRAAVNVQVIAGKDFEFMKVAEDCITTKSTINTQTKNIIVSLDLTGLVSFYIRPTSTGDFKIIIHADADLGTDKVEKDLRVNHEGASHYISKTVLADVRLKKYYSFYLMSNIDLEEVMPGSSRVGATAVGNIMGSALKIKSASSGMVRFIWDLYNMKYLRSVGKLLDEKKAEMVENLSTEYQGFIKNRIAKKSFGNVWTTALAAKTLGHVKDWIEIEPQYITEALNYLKQQQESDGGFKETEDSGTSIALTAFSAIAFLENEKYLLTYESVIKRSVTFISQSTKKILTNLDLALSAYSLTLRNDKNMDNYLNQLRTNAIIYDDEMYWKLVGKNINSNTNISSEIQIASYALLANLKADRLEDSIKILRWLMKKKGEFSSVKEAIVLQALQEAAEILHSEEINMDIYLVDDNDISHPVHIGHENQFVPKSIDLPSNTTSVSIMANGTGIAALDIWWKFNLRTEKISKNFEVKVEVDSNSSEQAIMLKACTSFIPDANQTVSEIAVMEVALPSGFEFNEQSKKLLEEAGLTVKFYSN